MEVIDISSDSSDTIILPYTTSNSQKKENSSITDDDSDLKAHKVHNFYGLSSDEDEIVPQKYINSQWKHHELIENQVDLSSDLNDSVIASYTKTNDLESVDTNLKKYSSCSDYNSVPNSYETNDFCSSSKEEMVTFKDNDTKAKHFELMEYEDSIVSVCDKKNLESDDFLTELYNKYLPSTVVKNVNEKANLWDISQSSDEGTSGNDSLSQKSTKNEGVSKKNKKQVENHSKKKNLEERRILKQIERDKKKEAKEKEKAMKRSVKTIQRSTSKEQCIKNIIVGIGANIIEQGYGEAIKSTLNANNISTKSVSDFPDLITWTRKIQTLESLLLKETECSEKHCLLVMSSKEFSNCVRQGKLANRVKDILTTNFDHVTVAVFGIDRPTENQELAIIGVEMLMKCYWEFFKSVEPLATFIYMTTKAVAQIPYKLEQAAKLKTQNVYYNDSNKDTVRVDKNGNGLSRLWHQMLTMFPLARLETAEAITSVYPTPYKLFKAYEDCERKEELLQDLPIRRAQGPLTAVRKLGPELSKKACTFFTSTENKML